ncbi:MAG: LysM peptidoglycan-binding domain-containing protein [Lachnospiraceae bacterium]|nr:LysM peptidoglycan-binding domain-containing protein [Lachnospiraceae bacterium]
MDLPKNITQIGEADASCKIYVEDYVVSYLKQLNPLARDKTMAAALYGRRKTEENKSFLFVYGAGKLDFIQKETKHLSQAQLQEIERIRRQYFQDYEFLGYRILDGEMVDGFHVREQDVCRYVSGYAQFYEKNEAMLSYMLESRQAEATPEAVNYEKYEAARGRQEKRRAKYVKHGEEKGGEDTSVRARKGGMQVAVAALLTLLCALGLAMNSSVLEGKGFSWDRLKEEFLERKLPEGTELASAGSVTGGALGQGLNEASGQALDETWDEEILAASGRVANEEILVASGEKTTDESKVTKGKTADDETGTASEKESGEEVEVKQSHPAEGEGLKAPETSTVEETTPVATEASEARGTDKNAQNADNGARDTDKNAQDAQAAETAGEIIEEEEKKKQSTYVVQAGDTLTGISIRTYGSEKYIGQICKLNSIKNPDEIKVGQKILLP